MRHQFRGKTWSCTPPTGRPWRFPPRPRVGRILQQVRKRHQHRLGVRIKRNGQPAKGAARERDGQRQLKGAHMAAKSLRQVVEKPLQQAKPALLFARFVNFAIGPRDEVFQVAARFRLGGKRRDFGQVGGGALVKVDENVPDLMPASCRSPARPQGGRAAFPVRFQTGRSLGDKTLEINDHSNCLCLTLRYCETSSALNRSLFEQRKLHAAPLQNFFQLAQILPRQMPAQTLIQIVQRVARPAGKQRADARRLQHVHQHQMLAAEQFHVAHKAFRQLRIVQRRQKNQQRARRRSRRRMKVQIRQNPARRFWAGACKARRGRRCNGPAPFFARTNYSTLSLNVSRPNKSPCCSAASPSANAAVR